MELFQYPYPSTLVSGTLIKRYKRFFVDVQLDGADEIVTAHCVNTGSMEGICLPGLKVWISPADNPKRKLKWTLELVEKNGTIIGANTAMPNRIVKMGLERRLIPGFKKWKNLTAEKKFHENSRVDFHIEDAKGEHYIEVKNCHLGYPDGKGYFPDSVSERAAKHLEHLLDMVREGHRATVLFTAQLNSVKTVRPSDVHDPVFAETARKVAKNGIDFKVLLINPTPQALIVEKIVSADLKPYKTKLIERWRLENKLK